MKLVIPRNNLVQRARVGVFLEHHKVLQQIQPAPPLEHTAHQHFQFQRGFLGITFTVDGAPDFEPLLICGERADARLQAITHQQHRVVVQQRGNLGLVSLQLRVGAPDGCVLVRRVFEFNQAQWQSVYEHHDIRPPVVLALNHRVLVHRQPVVGVHVGKIHQPRKITFD